MKLLDVVLMLISQRHSFTKSKVEILIAIPIGSGKKIIELEKNIELLKQNKYLL